VPTLDGPVLMALARSAGSTGGVRKVLARLVEQGLVTVRPAGGALLYEANKDHVAWPTVAGLADIRGEFLSRLSSEMITWSPRARSAALLSSTAHAAGDTASDVEIVVVRRRSTDPGDAAWLDNVSRLRERVRSWTGNGCQIYDVGTGDLARQIKTADPLVEEWARDALTFAGKDFTKLLAELGK
jgi:hypothetical protein